MKLDEALYILKENHYVCNAAGYNGFELDYPSVDYYKEQIKIELKIEGMPSDRAAAFIQIQIHQFLNK